MISVVYGDTTLEIRGLSTDNKPVNNKIGNGSVFIEMDTLKVFMFDQENMQ